jgi:hypothetical protein
MFGPPPDSISCYRFITLACLPVYQSMHRYYYLRSSVSTILAIAAVAVLSFFLSFSLLTELEADTLPGQSHSYSHQCTRKAGVKVVVSLTAEESQQALQVMVPRINIPELVNDGG